MSVVWWINNHLLPVIYVERGNTYWFRVQVNDGIRNENVAIPAVTTSMFSGRAETTPEIATPTTPSTSRITPRAATASKCAPSSVWRTSTRESRT